METIVFDVGETLVRDDRYWASWADWLGIPRHTISALVGAATVQNRDNADALRLIKPGIDVGEAYRAREAAGRGEHLDESDLYPDVRPALAGLQSLGIRVVLAGNQTVKAGELLRGLDLPADLVVTSGEWGVAKPSPEFFTRVIEAAKSAPDRTVYVGDHPAYDLFPAKEAGLRVAHLRRGPWGYLWADDPDVVAAADWRIDNLTQLASIAADGGSGGGGGNGGSGGNRGDEDVREQDAEDGAVHD
ncbi:HAD family hydrolase [Streptomyces sp. NPDC058391]|uniref:HAD family hydrolase n=1 Tax=Streptomyces sp. NPDC058391 TaxID=3346476 RepID=UPI003650CD5D